MNEIVAGIIRHALTALGGVLVSGLYLTTTQSATIVVEEPLDRRPGTCESASAVPVTLVKETEIVSEQQVPRSRRLLLTMVALFIVGTLALIAFVLLSDFPGQPEGSANKADAPPEDVRRER